MKVILPDYDVIDVFESRVRFWTGDEKIIDLFRLMYLNHLNYLNPEAELDVYDIVDNDYVNYCKVVFENDEYYEEIKSANLNDEIDISETTPYSYIESASDDLKMFLVRK